MHDNIGDSVWKFYKTGCHLGNQFQYWFQHTGKMSSLLLLCLKKSPCPSYQVHQSLKSSKWLSKLPSGTSTTLHGRVSQPFRTAHSGTHMKWTCRNWTHKSPFSLLQRRNYISVHRKVRTLPKHSRAGTGLLHVARQSGTVSKPATEVVKKEIKRSDVVRLFALAKPEKMQILGKLICLFIYIFLYYWFQYMHVTFDWRQCLERNFLLEKLSMLNFVKYFHGTLCFGLEAGGFLS